MGDKLCCHSICNPSFNKKQSLANSSNIKYTYKDKAEFSYYLMKEILNHTYKTTGDLYVKWTVRVWVEIAKNKQKGEFHQATLLNHWANKGRFKYIRKIFIREREMSVCAYVQLYLYMITDYTYVCVLVTHCFLNFLLSEILLKITFLILILKVFYWYGFYLLIFTKLKTDMHWQNMYKKIKHIRY